MKIVVIGGTGLIGSKVVEKVRQKGHQAIAAAPSTGVDTLTGEGLAEALADAAVVVDVSNSPSFEEEAAMDVAEQHRQHISRWFYPCSHEMHANLAEMYVADARFSEHYERRRPGLAAFVRDAVLANGLRAL